MGVDRIVRGLLFPAVLASSLGLVLEASAQEADQAPIPTVESRGKPIDAEFRQVYGQLDPETLEKYNSEKQYDKVLEVNRNLVGVVSSYDFSDLSNEERARVAHWCNEVGVALERTSDNREGFQEALSVYDLGLRADPTSAHLNYNAALVALMKLGLREQGASYIKGFLENVDPKHHQTEGVVSGIRWLRKNGYGHFVPEKFD